MAPIDFFDRILIYYRKDDSKSINQPPSSSLQPILVRPFDRLTADPEKNVQVITPETAAILSVSDPCLIVTTIQPLLLHSSGVTTPASHQPYSPVPEYPALAKNHFFCFLEFAAPPACFLAPSPCHCSQCSTIVACSKADDDTLWNYIKISFRKRNRPCIRATAFSQCNPKSPV